MSNTCTLDHLYICLNAYIERIFKLSQTYILYTAQETELWSTKAWVFTVAC